MTSEAAIKALPPRFILGEPLQGRQGKRTSLAPAALQPDPYLHVPALGLVLRPEIAALTMSGSSVLVAVNALMLKRLRLPEGAPARAHQASETKNESHSTIGGSASSESGASQI